MTEACAFIIGPPIGKTILSSNQIKEYLENGVNIFYYSQNKYNSKINFIFT